MRSSPLCVASLSVCVCVCVCECSLNMEVLGEDCVLQGLVYAVTLHFGCCCVIHTPMRRRFRAQYNLQGSPGADCCTTTFCACCAIGQEAREIHARGPPPLMQMNGGKMMVGGRPVMPGQVPVVVMAQPHPGPYMAVPVNQGQPPQAVYAQPYTTNRPPAYSPYSG
jgi:Cys-rich protein (TIGR01571 family)